MTNSIYRSRIAFILILSIVQPIDTFAQRQMGQDIEGEAVIQKVCLQKNSILQYGPTENTITYSLLTMFGVPLIN